MTPSYKIRSFEINISNYLSEYPKEGDANHPREFRVPLLNSIGYVPFAGEYVNASLQEFDKISRFFHSPLFWFAPEILEMEFSRALNGT